MNSFDGRYMTAFAAVGGMEGWKRTDPSSGVLYDTKTNTELLGGLSQPHSATARGDSVYLCNSGIGEFCRYREHVSETIARLPGYTRGIAFVDDNTAVVGFSAKRASARIDVKDAQTGLAVVDIRSGEVPFRAYFDQKEIFNVFVMDGSNTAIKLTD